MHLQPYYRAIGFAEEQFPEAQVYANSAFSLPLYPGLKDLDMQNVVATLAALLQA